MTSETRDEIQRRIAAGESVRDIALALGITTQAVYSHLRRAGIAPPKRGAA